MRILSAVLVPIVAVLTLACSNGSGATASPEPSRPAAVPSGSLPPAESGPIPPPDILDPIVADAAVRTGVPAAEIVFVSSVEQEWPDGSLGCPQPGMAYTQALVSGFQVIVRAGGRDLDYRVRGPGRFRLCERP